MPDWCWSPGVRRPFDGSDGRHLGLSVRHGWLSLAQARSSTIRSRSSISRIVADETRPQCSTRRSRSAAWICSTRTTLEVRTPPSGGVMRTCSGMPRSRVDSGTTMTSGQGPALMPSPETTTTGRWPCCSCPIRPLDGCSSHTSPRSGNVVRRFVTQRVGGGSFRLLQFGHVAAPLLGVGQDLGEPCG